MKNDTVSSGNINISIAHTEKNDMDQIELKLSLDEVNVLLECIGQLPTSSGVYPLMVKIHTQANECLSATADQSKSATNKTKP